MNYLVHATSVHPSLCLQYLILLFTIDTVTVIILLLLLLFYYYHHYKTVADKPLQAGLFPGVAELTTHLSRLINILWLPLCQINKFGFYFPWRLLRSPILVGHQRAWLARRLAGSCPAWWRGRSRCCGRVACRWQTAGQSTKWVPPQIYGQTNHAPRWAPLSWEWPRQVLPGVANGKHGARELQPSVDRDCKTWGNYPVSAPVW
jgi:hypothetical protein